MSIRAHVAGLQRAYDEALSGQEEPSCTSIHSYEAYRSICQWWGKPPMTAKDLYDGADSTPGTAQ